jgi:iron complex outermembrane receptor protein
MKKLVLALTFITCLANNGFSQKATVKGIATYAITQESLIGATVLFGPGKGSVTDIDGNFTLEIPPGEHTLTCSYVGFVSQEKTITTEANKTYTVNFSLQTVTLNEVKIIADVAIDRSTPVAYVNISAAKISEELASQDMPMILNSTPGVYATQTGGGDGDARVSIRGFNQRNVGVMIDGIPVNDMETGQVYWSNWFGLDMVTRTMQVQRGLGAAKVALPSVGGSINILTAGINNKAGYKVKQEIGSFGFQRTSFGINSGKLKNGWGLSFAGSYKQSNGWVQQTSSKGYFYFGKIEKVLGKHRVSLTAFGAPQDHAQRSYKNNIAVFDMETANKLGIDTTSETVNSLNGTPRPIKTYGYNYNQHWGELERYNITPYGDTIHAQKEILNSRINFFHKPQFALRDFWNISPRFYLTTVAYMSSGKGGGTSFTNENLLDENGQLAFQKVYDQNSGYTKTVFGQDPSIDNTYSSYLHKSGEVLRTSNNNHFWYGALSTFNYELTDFWTISGGLDFRSYTGYHYRTVHDLIGGDYFVEDVDDRNPNHNNYMKSVGDTIDFYNESKVRWSGVFGQAEYKKDKLSTFFNFSTSLSAYQRIDYYQKNDLVIGDHTLNKVIGFGDVMYYNDGNYLIAEEGATVRSSGDTTFVKNTGETEDYILNSEAYTIDSPEARASTTDWKYLPGYTLKAGANYNFTDVLNGFVNVGYLSKAPRFSNVFDFSNKEFKEIVDEKVVGFEVGIGYRSKKFTANINAYYTSWKNKPLDRAFRVIIDDESFSANVPGIDALHTGVELDFAYKVTKKFTVEGIVSLGNWIWNSAATFSILDDSGQPVLDENDDLVQVDFDAKGVKVGDAAQSQLGFKLNYQFDKGFYVSGRGTFFGNNYANFDPFSLQPDEVTGIDSFDKEGNPRQPWRMPNYFLLDAHAGYKLTVGKGTLNLRFSLLNVLNATYIIDAQNNDSNSGFGTNFDASSAAVFFGPERRFNTSLQLSF